jgi:DNA-binding response OmpR family regulator
MSNPVEPTRKAILFIEDQELHYEQVAAYLRLHGYQCRRVARAESRLIRQKALELRPVAAVVDFILLSPSQRELDKLARTNAITCPSLRRRTPPLARSTMGSKAFAFCGRYAQP